MIILGIETSCDETAAAVVRDGKEILSSVIASQVSIHAPYGGVVPELASRQASEYIIPVIESALEKAGVSCEELDALGVTQGPGLVGALLVGLSAAKAMAYALGKPLIAVNHLEGHIQAAFISGGIPEYLLFAWSFPAAIPLYTGWIGTAAPGCWELRGTTRPERHSTK